MEATMLSTTKATTTASSRKIPITTKIRMALTNQSQVDGQMKVQRFQSVMANNRVPARGGRCRRLLLGELRMAI